MEPSDRTDITIIPFEGMMPTIAPGVFIAAGARIIGDVSIGEGSSIWFNVVIRGDVNTITIGRRTNIQDLTMCHVTHRKHALSVGDDVTVGHSAVLHGCTVHDRVLVGMHATLLDACEIGSGSIIAAGALVRERFVVPEGVLVAGVPGKVIRELTDEERAAAAQGAVNYEGYVQRYRG
jgi:carbonic anhydrase/acetyltransferase-like protein (isoleucine patch superfamily)